MGFSIIYIKVIDASKTNVVYEAKGQGDASNQFYIWLNNHAMTRRWYGWTSYGWVFTNSLDDVSIRLHWAQYFQEADASDETMLTRRFMNALIRDDWQRVSYPQPSEESSAWQ